MLATVLGSLLAVSAAPAMATPHWSDATHGIKVSGSLTVSASGYATKTCTAPAEQESMMEPSWAMVGSLHTSGGTMRFGCAGAGEPFEIMLYLTSLQTTSVSVSNSNPFLSTPWIVHYHGLGSTADWVNGSGSTQSTLTFANDTVGYIPGGPSIPVIANGTLQVTTKTGGLLTIQP